VARGHIDPDDPAIHRVQLRQGNLFLFEFHADLQTTQSARKFPVCGDNLCEKQG
jgi:hypothetical protein